ncbi:nucleoid occlusion protein [Natribacillus halophilus]|uniref:Chromosome partitioning protein, ParB family n=1 Tax=Natribacillus halophilus TaxID=549003 RepID=A0A1G8L2K1_9BACI|nr:nucleoid occlusion protein [Natribacillus halophilus]SDI49841.1 chromosome partitioning protein, ParB family [Natribacillus halophilus]
MRNSIQRFFGLGDEVKRENPEEGAGHSEEVRLLPITAIVPNPFQPRTIFSEETIDELARTIQTHGMLQPIIVRERENNYELIAGERRWRAAQKLEWSEVPSIVKEFNDAQTASLALIENLQREELTVIEEARAYEQLIHWHKLTQESLAQRLGKGQSTIANKLRLLSLPEEVQTALLQRDISERHARTLIRLKDESLQIQLLRAIIDHSLSVKETEAYAERWLENTEKPEEKKRTKKQHFPKDLRIAMNTIRQSLEMVEKSGMQVERQEEELDDYYQFTIRIPKK